MTEERTSWGAVAGDAIVPGWRVVEGLGGGKVTQVFLVASAVDSERRAVVKVARPDAGDLGRRSLTREAAHLRSVEHPAIPALVVDATNADPPHLVLTHVPGARLSTRVRLDGPLSVPEAAAVGHQIASALAALHDAGVAHLDVKPGNIVLARAASLIDLGIGRDFRAAASLRTPVGTRRWMSPEQRDPERFGGMGPEADVWGLGASLFLALTGRGPIDHLEVAPREFAVDPGRIADLAMHAALPPVLADIVLACLVWEPDDRPRVAWVRDAMAVDRVT